MTPRNPYDRNTIGRILKIEDCNYDRAKQQHQLYGLAVSAKRYVVYTRRKKALEIIKPSEHGLGVVFVPDKRRYKPKNCLDQEAEYARWIMEAWEQLLDRHFRSGRDPENALVAQGWRIGKLPAVMRIRVTTPNVMEALRKRDPGAAKPYNFAISPILLEAAKDCALVAPFSKHKEDWLTQDYTEIHTGGNRQARFRLPRADAHASNARGSGVASLPTPGGEIPFPWRQALRRVHQWSARLATNSSYVPIRLHRERDRASSSGRGGDQRS